MEPRIAYNKYSPNALHAMFALEKHLFHHRGKTPAPHQTSRFADQRLRLLH